MATYAFTGAQFLNLSIDKNYKGANDFSLHLNKKITLEGYLYSKDATLGVGKNYSTISGILATDSGDYSDIIINNENFGKGKVLGISFPQGNPVRIGSYIYDIEIKENSDFSLLSTGLYGKYLTGLREQILDFSEKLNCNYARDKKTFDHSISIQLNDTGQNLINSSRQIASGIFNDSINLPITNNSSGLYNLIKNLKSTFKEDYDLVSNKINFSKNIEIYDSGDINNYTVYFTHNISKDSRGITSVSEDGEILLLSSNNYPFASGILSSLYSNAYNRCKDFFDKNKSFSSLSLNDSNNLITDDLQNNPVEFGSNYDLSMFNIKYRVLYNNDPNIFNNYSLEYSTSKNLSNLGLEEISENGSITYFGNSTTFYPKSIIAQRTGQFSKIKSINENFSLLNSNNIYQSRFGYSFVASPNDNNILTNDSNFNFISVEVANNYPKDIVNEYIIPNHPSGFVLPNLSTMDTLQQININITAIIKSSQSPSGQVILNRLVNTGLSNLPLVGVTTLNNCSYTYNNNNQVTLNLSALYTS